MRKLLHAMTVATLLSTASAARAETPAAPAAPAAPKSDGLTFSIGDASIKFYGFARLDMHFDDSHPNNTHLIYCIPSEDPNAPAGIGEDKNSHNFTMHAKLTRLGLDVSSPPIGKLGDATIMGRIEIDFLAEENVRTTRPLPRLRLAYAKLAWDDLSILVGQEWDVFAPLVPEVSGEFVLWGAGNVGDRRPMLRVDYTPKLGGDQLFLQGAVGLSGGIDNQNLDGTTSPYVDGESSGLPCFEGRIGYKGGHVWLEKKFWQAGVWGYYAQERLEDPLPAGYTEDRYTANVVGLDATLPILDMLDVRGEAWVGKNVNDIRGGILQGVSTVDGGQEIKSRGYWAEVVVRSCDWHALHVGASRDNPDDRDLAATSGTTIPTGAKDNRVLYICNRFNLGGGVKVGLDYLNWITQWRGDLDPGRDNRYSMFFMYAF